MQELDQQEMTKAKHRRKWSRGNESRDRREEDMIRLPKSQALGAKGSRGSQRFQDSDSGDSSGE